MLIALAPSSQHFVTKEGIVIHGITSGIGMSDRVPSIRRILAAVIVLASVVVAYAVYSQAASGRAVQDRVAILKRQNATIQQQVADRQREVGAAGGSAWLEEEARKLGYVKPGEHIYILTPPGQPLPGAGGVDFTSPPTFIALPGAATAAPPAVSTAGPAATPSAPPRPTPVAFSLPAPPVHH